MREHGIHDRELCSRGGFRLGLDRRADESFDGVDGDGCACLLQGEKGLKQNAPRAQRCHRGAQRFQFVDDTVRAVADQRDGLLSVDQRLDRGEFALAVE